MFWLTLLSGILVLVSLIKLISRPKNFPPGPRGLPIVGYLPFIPKDKPLFKMLQDLAETYGNILGFYVGPSKPFLSVVGPSAVKEALQNDDLNGRPSGAIIQTRTFGERLGLMFADGDKWQEQRRFTLRHLRDLGFGKTSIEDQMMNEIHDLLSDIKSALSSDPGNVVEFRSIFGVSVINILWAIIGGKRYERDDAEFQKLLSNVDLFVRTGNTIRGNIPIPGFLIRMFPSIPRWVGIRTELFHPLQQFFGETIDEHLVTRSEGDAPRDFIDIYLDEMKVQQERNPDTSFSRNQLIATIQDLFIAGSDTSKNSIGFVILYLLNYPEVKTKMQIELDEICGDSLPTLAHRSSLPFTEAVLMEVMRMASIAPTAIPHCALRDTKLQGYSIPKGSVVMVNLQSVFKDATIWGDPENFRPERHLNEEGKVIKNDAFIPFGLGKRICLGESLARNTVFLFTAALVKTFEFSALPNEDPPTLEPMSGLVLAPAPFKAVVTLRA